MKSLMQAALLSLVLLTVVGLLPMAAVQAKEGEVLGIHILSPEELSSAKELLAPTDSDSWNYVTIPFSLSDLEKKESWQQFFDQAKAKKVIPVVRLVTKFEDESWQQPSRKEIVDMLEFLSQLTWPTDKKYVIVFNEVNHKKEWGGQIDPAGYAEVLKFASNWARSENTGFVVMPAAMDLAAPDGSQTMEAFNYLQQMHNADPDIFSYVDIWNSHSYPNPGFSASPYLKTKNSLRGFEHELSFLKQKTGKDFQVFISETGWVSSRATNRWLEAYYTYALQHIWSHPQVIGVTPFILKGDPGPFSNFGFLDRNNNPTIHYSALQNALKKVKRSS